MIIGRNFLVSECQYRQLAVTSSIEEEVEKLVWSTRWGADTVMDLHRPLYPRNPRVDPAQQPGADWYRADLPALEKVNGIAENLTRKSSAIPCWNRPSKASTTSRFTPAYCCATSR